VPAEDKKRAARRKLVDRVLRGPGQASQQLRARAFSNAGLPPALQVLMAAYVSTVNESAFCIGAHTATASRAYQDGAKVQAALADLDGAPVDDGLRATLRMLGKLTGEGKVGAEDVRSVALQRSGMPDGGPAIGESHYCRRQEACARLC
jgi:AhpD family alkylhydroperoxidase